MYRLLIVDDAEENLEILKNALQNDYRISIAKDGSNALKLLEVMVPDLILLDINMPILDGFETLREIKQIDKLRDVPVIFVTGETSIRDKAAGFQAGAVDYITKPFELLEVRLRIRTHLELSKSREEKQELLRGTLSGTIQAFLEILSMRNPFAYTFSCGTKKMASAVATYLQVEELWKVEIAAMLSMVGTFNMEPKALETLLAGYSISDEEQSVFLGHPAAGARLLGKIPRLDDVAEIIRGQGEPLGAIAFDPRNAVLAGSQILCAVINHQILALRGHNRGAAVILMMQDNERYNLQVLKAMRQVVQSETEEIVSIPVSELRIGMLIQDEIKSADGNVVIVPGATLSSLMLEHLKLLAETGKIGRTVRVRFFDNEAAL
jgi:CheY-like chemotaxis protein